MPAPFGISSRQEGVEMATLTVAAVRAGYVLMGRKATLAKVEELLAEPAVRAADLVVFPEVFVPGTPIWDGDEQWFAMLADQAPWSYRARPPIG
jgi:nitrilase